MMDIVSSLAIPVILLFFSFFLFNEKKGFYNAFVTGARQGLETCISLIPTMVLLLVAISMLSASGATDFLSKLFAPCAAVLGIPSEIMPLLITRPVSGSASNAAYSELLTLHGADSFPSFAASIIMGSSDTLIYIISVYFSGAPSVRKSAHAFPVAIIVMLFCIFFSCFIARLFY